MHTLALLFNPSITPRAYLDLDGLGGLVKARAVVNEAEKVVAGVQQANE